MVAYYCGTCHRIVAWRALILNGIVQTERTYYRDINGLSSPHGSAGGIGVFGGAKQRKGVEIDIWRKQYRFEGSERIGAIAFSYTFFDVSEGQKRS